MVLLVIGVVCVFLPRYNKLRVMQQRRDETDQENRQLEARDKELRAFCKRFVTDPGFVERVAQELGMVRPGEIMVKYMDERQEPTNEDRY